VGSGSFSPVRGEPATERVPMLDADGTDVEVVNRHRG
jgi:hypothetical protein